MEPTAALVGVDAGQQQSSNLNQALFKSVKVEANTVSEGNKCLKGEHCKPISASCYDWICSRKRCSLVFKLNPCKRIRTSPLVSISLHYITFDVFGYPQHKFILAEKQQGQEVFYIGMKTTI